MAWKRKTLCMASLMASFPLKEKEKLERPPLILAPCSCSCGEEGGGGGEREGGEGEREEEGGGRGGGEGEGKRENVGKAAQQHMVHTHSLTMCKPATGCTLYLDQSCCFNEGNSIFVVFLNACCDG